MPLKDALTLAEVTVNERVLDDTAEIPPKMSSVLALTDTGLFVLRASAGVVEREVAIATELRVAAVPACTF